VSEFQLFILLTGVFSGFAGYVISEKQIFDIFYSSLSDIVQFSICFILSLLTLFALTLPVFGFIAAVFNLEMGTIVVIYIVTAIFTPIPVLFVATIIYHDFIDVANIILAPLIATLVSFVLGFNGIVHFGLDKILWFDPLLLGATDFLIGSFCSVLSGLVATVTLFILRLFGNIVK